MQYEVEVGGRLRHVVVARAGDGFAVAVDGHTLHVDAARIDAQTQECPIHCGGSRGMPGCGLMMRRTKASVSRTDSDFLATRLRHSDLLGGATRSPKSARVAHLDAALFQQFLHLVGELRQAQYDCVTAARERPTASAAA